MKFGVVAQRLTLINFNFSPDCSGCTQILQHQTIPSAQGRTGNSVQQEMGFTHQPLSPIENQYLSFPLSKKEDIHRTGPTL